MAITKRLELRLEILPDGLVQVREETLVEEDGVLIARTYHRRVLVPTLAAHPAGEHERIKAVTAVVWTPQVVADYERKQREAQETLLAELRAQGLQPLIILPPEEPPQ